MVWWWLGAVGCGDMAMDVVWGGRWQLGRVVSVKKGCGGCRQFHGPCSSLASHPSIFTVVVIAAAECRWHQQHVSLVRHHGTPRGYHLVFKGWVVLTVHSSSAHRFCSSSHVHTPREPGLLVNVVVTEVSCSSQVTWKWNWEVATLNE
jgi:hypothetical protein